LGSRSRKRGKTQARPVPAPAERKAERERIRGEERDAAIRAGLEPLAPGERPPALIAAIVVCLLIALSNVGLVLAGYEIKEDGNGTATGAFVFAAVMLVAAWGMWTQRYWAVLGFQTLLALTVVIAALSLMVASNVAAAALCLVVLGLGGWLFWKLVRVLSRMKTPENPFA
jgi:hypothetical protein